MAKPRNVNIAIKIWIIIPPWFRNQTGNMVGGNCSIAGAVQLMRFFLYVRYGPSSITVVSWVDAVDIVIVDDNNDSIVDEPIPESSSFDGMFDENRSDDWVGSFGSSSESAALSPTSPAE